MDPIATNDNSGNTYYCQVDTYWAVKEYLGGGRSVRLFGLDRTAYSDESLGDDLTVYTIELDYWEYWPLVKKKKTWRHLSTTDRDAIREAIPDAAMEHAWYELNVEFVNHSSSYLYETFSEDLPRFFKVGRLEPLVSGPALHSFGSMGSRTSLALSRHLPAPLSTRNSNRVSPPFVFDAFHVGQGMCSLVHDGKDGFLLDAGAAKPVTRKRYFSGASFKNELTLAVQPLQSLQMIVSHADYDHWKLLAWDKQLLNRIATIYVPSGQTSLALMDKKIKGKIVVLGDSSWTLQAGTKLTFHRSIPAKLDSNGDCLVTTFERDGQAVLFAGDYVYERFLVDGNPAINGLHGQRYAAVVVPHHGDAASANNVVSPLNVGAKAFFSAGTHQGYKHPTNSSLAAHKAAHFQNISSPHTDDILKVNLL